MEKRKRKRQKAYSKKSWLNISKLGERNKHPEPGILNSSKKKKKINPKRPTPRHIIIELSKVKDKKKTLKQQGENSLLRTGYLHKTINRNFLSQ